MRALSTPVIRITLAMALFILLLSLLDREQMAAVIRRASLSHIALILPLWPILLVISAWRWSAALRGYAICLPFGRVLRITWVSWFFSNFLPTGLGGDSYRFVALMKNGEIGKGRLLSSILIDRVVALLAILVFTIAFGALHLDRIAAHPVLLALYAGSGLCLVAAAGIWTGASRLTFDPNRGMRAMRAGKRMITAVLALPGPVVIAATAISAAFLLVSVFSLYLGFAAFHASVPFSLLLFLVPLVTLSELIPLSMNAIGVREGAAVYIFSLFGVDAEITLAAYILIRILFTLASATGGIVHAIARDRKTRVLQ